MAEVTTRELKNGLSAWLRRAEAGERVVVTRGGRPVAALIPLADLPSGDARAILADLADRGMVRLGSGLQGCFDGPRAPSRGRSAAEMVSEDRR